MFLIRLFIIALIIAYVIWYVSNRILGKNIAIAKIIASTLVGISVVILLLSILSHLVEQF